MLHLLSFKIFIEFIICASYKLPKVSDSYAEILRISRIYQKREGSWWWWQPRKEENTSDKEKSLGKGQRLKKRDQEIKSSSVWLGCRVCWEVARDGAEKVSTG